MGSIVKYFSLMSVVFFLLLSGCKVDYVSRADSNKAYVSGSACGTSKEQVKEDAVNDITKNYPLIAEDLKEYISVYALESNTSICYEAVITHKRWSRYASVIQDKKEEITGHSTEYVGIFEYNNKDVLINTLLTERQQFNKKLESAKKIAPMEVEPFSVDFKSLENSVNVLPSVKMQVRGCNSSKNYKCDVKFMANVKDESKELTYLWDFGEGSKSEKKSATHRYATEGSYSVSLQVTDESGLSTFRVKDVLVTKSKQKQKKKAKKKSSLKAYFILKKKYYGVNQSVFFDNRSRSTASEIKEYLWDFGDGATSTVRNPKHSYKKRGKYVVKYKVCNADKDCAYASTRVNVITPAKKATAPKPVKKEQKAAILTTPGIDAKAGETIESYMAKKGPPAKKIAKKNATMTAYLYGSVWVLAKRGKIECAVQEDALKTSLMGHPKKCRWHERNEKGHMVMLKQ